MLQTKGAGSGVSQSELESLQGQLAEKDAEIQALLFRANVLDCFENSGWGNAIYNGKGSFTDNKFAPYPVKLSSYVTDGKFRSSGEYFLFIRLTALYASSGLACHFMVKHKGEEIYSESGKDFGSLTNDDAVAKLACIKLNASYDDTLTTTCYSNNTSAFNSPCYAKAKFVLMKNQ